jgi:hypothetical protein
MQQLVWSDTLAIVAQNWVNQCKFAYDNTGVHIPGFGQYFRQNMRSYGDYQLKSPIDALVATVGIWFKQSKDYPSHAIEAHSITDEPAHTARFKTMIWAQANQVTGTFQRSQPITGNSPNAPYFAPNLTGNAPNIAVNAPNIIASLGWLWNHYSNTK